MAMPSITGSTAQHYEEMDLGTSLFTREEDSVATGQQTYSISSDDDKQYPDHDHHGDAETYLQDEHSDSLPVTPGLSETDDLMSLQSSGQNSSSKRKSHSGYTSSNAKRHKPNDLQRSTDDELDHDANDAIYSNELDRGKDSGSNLDEDESTYDYIYADEEGHDSIPSPSTSPSVTLGASPAPRNSTRTHTSHLRGPQPADSRAEQPLNDAAIPIPDLGKSLLFSQVSSTPPVLQATAASKKVALRGSYTSPASDVAQAANGHNTGEALSPLDARIRELRDEGQTWQGTADAVNAEFKMELLGVEATVACESPWPRLSWPVSRDLAMALPAEVFRTAERSTKLHDHVDSMYLANGIVAVYSRHARSNPAILPSTFRVKTEEAQIVAMAQFPPFAPLAKSAVPNVGLTMSPMPALPSELQDNLAANSNDETAFVSSIPDDEVLFGVFNRQSKKLWAVVAEEVSTKTEKQVSAEQVAARIATLRGMRRTSA